MDQAVIQALHGLIPTFSGALPPELVSLAKSLLAQSHTKASNLKGEEEIARPYACANIACERLKQSLSLPKIEPRPPCPPKVYRGLYTHLQSTLLSKGQEPSKRPPPNDTASESSQRIPQKSKSYETRTPRRALAGRTIVSASQTYKDEEPPIWVMYVIRRLCRSLRAPAAPPHVFAGISSIHPAAKHIPDIADELDLAALIVAVTFFVSSRLSGVTIRSDQLVQKMNIAQDTMKDIAQERSEIKEITEPQIRVHMRMIVDQKWIEMDWFKNVKMGSGLGLEDDHSSDDSQTATSSEPDDDSNALGRSEQQRRLHQANDVEYLQPGLATMMQPKVDYLSDESLNEYEIWEAGIRRRMDRMKNASAGEGNGVDVQATG